MGFTELTTNVLLLGAQNLTDTAGAPLFNLIIKKVILKCILLTLWDFYSLEIIPLTTNLNSSHLPEVFTGLSVSISSYPSLFE